MPNLIANVLSRMCGRASTAFSATAEKVATELPAPSAEKVLGRDVLASPSPTISPQSNPLSGRPFQPIKRYFPSENGPAPLRYDRLNRPIIADPNAAVRSWCAQMNREAAWRRLGA